MPRLRVLVEGTVQGVGFRPFVHRIALARSLAGWVRNRPDGVELEVQGPEPDLADFLRALREERPAPARIERLAPEPVPEEPGAAGFTIDASGAAEAALPVLPPDLAVCPACLRELEDPGDRRFRHPFINCTHCGPRYTLVAALPYDRPRTAMAHFPLCPACDREYRDPTDRRFHAQPVACPDCGPRLALVDPAGAALADGEAALRGAAAALLRGRVLALKGLGGYQLLVDATDPAAVALLRARKHREEKPFAVMFPDAGALGEACVAGPAELDLLTGPEAPILLLDRRPGARVAGGVAPGNPRLGAFLPTTALHRLLLAEVGRPLVCTSGNRSDEPMAFQDEEARARLGDLADLFLVHDRPVLRPVDDSVLRLDGDGPTFLRRARGYAPAPLRLDLEGPPVLALGAQQKATVALLFAGRLVVSQHLGDLGGPEGARLLERTVRDLLDFYGLRPERVACDLHPDYASTRLAERLAAELGADLHRVQHHHAHGAACRAEHGLAGRCLALAWDGTGLGTDGTAWGGEALRLEGAGFTRIGHLAPFPLPGGDRAARDPRRSAAGLLQATLGPGGWPERVRGWWTEGERDLLHAALARDLNCPRSSSVGRLFDAVAALTGIHARPGFEGQAAMALEHAAPGAADGPAWPWAFREEGPALVADPGPLVRSLLADLAVGLDPGAASGRFHSALADLALAWARHAGLEAVLLTGGCFQNALLTGKVAARLAGAGFRVHRHRRLPPNDGSIAAGQAALAAAGPASRNSWP